MNPARNPVLPIHTSTSGVRRTGQLLLRAGQHATNPKEEPVNDD